MSEILIGFVLGIATMVTITILVLGVIAFFKVIKLKKVTDFKLKELNEYIKNESIENLHQHDDIRDEIQKRNEEISTEIVKTKDEFYKAMDSRLEKLEQKLTKTLQK